MTVEIGRDSFVAAERAQADAAANARRTRRAALEIALADARAAFASEVDARYASGARIARRDADTLEQIARRLLESLDALEPAFDRLDAARDLCAWRGADGVCIERAPWARSEIALAWADAFEPVLGSAALAVMEAAVRLETT